MRYDAEKVVLMVVNYMWKLVTYKAVGLAKYGQ